jgi:NifU-like protein involved in Fe-S cluster formation
MEVRSVNDIVRSHFVNPKNIGKIKKPTNTSKYKSGFCGDTVEVYAIIEDSVITDIKYNVFGCYAAIAASSIISEKIKGCNIDTLTNMTCEDVEQMMGGVEEEKINCVNTALTAFKGICK